MSSRGLTVSTHAPHLLTTANLSACVNVLIAHWNVATALVLPLGCLCAFGRGYPISFEGGLLQFCCESHVASLWGCERASSRSKTLSFAFGTAILFFPFLLTESSFTSYGKQGEKGLCRDSCRFKFFFLWGCLASFWSLAGLQYRLSFFLVITIQSCMREMGRRGVFFSRLGQGRTRARVKVAIDEKIWIV